MTIHAFPDGPAHGEGGASRGIALTLSEPGTHGKSHLRQADPPRPAPYRLYGVLLPMYALGYYLNAFVVVGAAGLVMGSGLALLGVALTVVLVIDAFKWQRSPGLGVALVLATTLSWPILVLTAMGRAEGHWWDVAYIWTEGIEILVMALVVDRRRSLWLYAPLLLLNVVPSAALLQTHASGAAYLPLWGEPFTWTSLPTFALLTWFCARRWVRGRSADHHSAR